MNVALITGATSVIGSAAARAFASEGYAVVLTARRKNVLDDLAAQIQANGGHALAASADVTVQAQIEQVVQRAIETFGGLDAAFNNAGGGGLTTVLADIEPSAFEETIRRNLTGSFLAMRAEIRAMLERGGGAIVNMASTAGLQGVSRLSPYCAAKHGIIGMSKAAALDYAERHIRINVVAPGTIANERINPEQREQISRYVPLRRIGEPEEVANLVRWLCSAQAQFITGSVFTIDGGQLAGTPAFNVRG